MISKAKRYITEPEYRFDIDAFLHINNLLSDKVFIKKAFKAHLGYSLDLNNPKTFNEKLQWLKLYDRKPIYTTMVDKVLVKDYVANIIGKEYIIPTLGVWDSPDEIDYSKLPDKFVLKCNHNSGLGMCICKDKSSLYINKVNRELQEGLKQNYYLTQREWPYKNVKRKIIAEEYLGTDLIDYRFYCFDGKVEYIYQYFNKTAEDDSKPMINNCNIYDRKWKLQEFHQASTPSGNTIAPIQLELMIELSEKLSRNCPFIRVDFYDINGKVFFGELTFYPGAGFSKFYPPEYDEVIGKKLILPR